ncbi:MAG: TIGR02117 family protein [Planctomycetes bacterium]|nr:TIGR02117 family protein [Planctomycetota bacterium]
MKTETNPEKPKLPLRKRIWKGFLRTFAFLFITILVYIAAGFILGRIPTNTTFRNAKVGIEIAVIHNGIHCDIAVPIQNDEFDWSELLDLKSAVPEGRELRYAMIGWGNRKFYLETPRWSDVKLKTILEAACGFGPTTIHVDLIGEIPKSGVDCRRLRLTSPQYKTLCEEILKSIDQSAEGSAKHMANSAYSNTDAFYEGLGRYHLFVTCNVWVGNILRKSGVQVGLWTPYPSTVFACLPEE